MLSFLTVALHDPPVSEKLYLGQWLHKTKMYPVNAIWLLIYIQCRIKFEG
jgi:hypothetical protein